MLFTADDAQRIEAGALTATIRKWKRPQAKPGGVYQTMRGWLRVQSVAVVPLHDVGHDDLAAAGLTSAADLAEFGVEPGDLVHVVHFERCDPPDRPDVGADAQLDDADVDDLRARLDRMDDRSPDGPWTRAVLDHIAANPGTRSADMAVELGREQAVLKADVRKLKRLGLTRSLEKGYELSPRGQALVDRL